ncbi:hypothetical protein SAMN02745180_02827 [Sporanaerobacter acetigenes DSM 13106]|uniref:Uncharacterized protein n=1 Tax=Sporanaerobacter acetigenes DSM 13106 TaxID=1123281 RepID=A0A1M5Z7Z3_9FIRM|nr:hypothetical protein SAMN02745180_02827 [Sporanaerobacter acetigenes DSM 13106]
MPTITKITPNKGNILPIIPNGEPAVILKAIIVQNIPKIIATTEPIKDIPDGPRPGLILFIIIPPLIINLKRYKHSPPSLTC